MIGCSVDSRPQDSRAVVPRLVELLKDPHPDMRRTAALSLGKIADTNSIPALIGSLRDKDALVREYSAWALGQIGPELTEDAALALTMALADDIRAVRAASALALGWTEPHGKFVGLLKQPFAVSEAETRLAVLEALLGLSMPSAYPIYLVALEDPDPRVRQTAVAGLGELADQRVLPFLRKHILQDADEGVRVETAYRLGKLGGQADVPTLEKVVETDPSGKVRLWASWALEGIEPSSTQ